MDLSQLSNVELMQLNQLTLDELERREVIRTRNNPISEYTEWLVADLSCAHRKACMPVAI